MYGAACSAFMKYTGICPAMTSTAAGPAPLYGMCVIFVPVSSLNSSVAMCGGEPLPELP